MPYHEYCADIFEAPPDGAVLIHACNCQGVWGSGVAREFKNKFPAAEKIHRAYCTTPDTVHHKRWLLGTAQLIPPQASDIQSNGRAYWIACLFTSLYYGKQKSKPDEIVDNTRKSLTHLHKLLLAQEKQRKIHLRSQLYTVRINSGTFNVPWDRTRGVLRVALLNLFVCNPTNSMLDKDRKPIWDDMKKHGFAITHTWDFTTPPSSQSPAQIDLGSSSQATSSNSQTSVQVASQPSSPKSPSSKSKKRKATPPPGSGSDSDSGSGSASSLTKRKKTKKSKKSKTTSTSNTTPKPTTTPNSGWTPINVSFTPSP